MFSIKILNERTVENLKNVKCLILKLNVTFCIIMSVAGHVTFKSAI